MMKDRLDSARMSGLPGAFFVAVVMSLLVTGCSDIDVGSSSTSSTLDIPTSTSMPGPLVSTTPSTTESTSIPPIDGPTEVWPYSSRAIGRELGRGEDFAASGDFVAVLVGEDSQATAVLSLESGQELWQMGFPESSGRILDLSDRLTWATYERVGAHSLDGQPLWDHEFGDTRWPSRALIRDDRTAVVLDPTTEGDYGPPLFVQFDESGTVLWSTQLSESRNDEDLQWVEPLIADDGLIIQTTDALYRLDWVSGEQEWRVPFAEADVETFDMSGLFEANGVVYAADPGGEFSDREGGEILGVDARTGETQMRHEVGRSPRLVGLVETWLIHTDQSGLHGVNTETHASWDADLPDVVAVIDAGLVVAVSPDTLLIINPEGERVSQVTTTITDPQLQPVVIEQIVLVPGWQGTEAIDFSSGQFVMTWPGESYANVVKLDDQRVVLGAAGDGIYLLQAPSR